MDPSSSVNGGDTEAAVQSDALAAAAGNLLIVGAVKDNAGVPVPGVTVQLSGAATKTSNSNADGIYRFEPLAAGTYTVEATKPGATFATASFTLSITKSVEQPFACTAGCDGTTAVVPLKELTIVDPSVVNDARASNASDGPWSFRFLMEQMTPSGTDPSDFVLNWIQGFKASAGPIHGFPVDTRSVDSGLVGIWPKRPDGKIDLAQSPFKLLAIVNRSDLHAIGDGEGRFIFGMVQNGFGQSFTVIFEYRLPVTNAATGVGIKRVDWIRQFHALGALPFGASYNTKLQAITDQFARAGTTPANPNGNSISQVRTNEIQFGGPWQLREFHLVNNAASQGFLTLSPTAQTPDPTLNEPAAQTPSPALISYLQNNRFHILGGLANVPSALIGGQSNEATFPTWSFSNFPSIDEKLRHTFAGQTCNGCHNGETSQIDGFYHVSPRVSGGADGTGAVSAFVLTSEFPRRSRFMQNRLTCNADFSNCSPGADPMP